MMTEDRVVSLCSFFENQVKYRPTLEAEKGYVGDDTGENIRVQLYVSTEYSDRTERCPLVWNRRFQSPRLRNLQDMGSKFPVTWSRH